MIFLNKPITLPTANAGAIFHAASTFVANRVNLAIILNNFTAKPTKRVIKTDDEATHS